jgi:membrane protein required for colicin V production
MTWVDIAVLGVLAISALLAFMRGFVREVLGIGSWIGAVIVSIWGFPYARPRFEQWFAGSPDLVNPATFGALFIGTLIVLMIVSHWIGAIVRGSVLGGLDRTLGLLFGLVRGAAVVVFAYIAAGVVLPVDRWPPQVLEARVLPLAYAGATWTVARLPEDYRPHIYPPPAGHVTTADALMQALPQGRAIGKPPVKE